MHCLNCFRSRDISMTYPKKKLTTPSKSWSAHYLLVQRDALFVSEQVHRSEMERRPLWTARLVAHAPTLDFIWARTKCPRSNKEKSLDNYLLTSFVEFGGAPSLAHLLLLHGEGHLAAVEHFLLSSFPLLDLQKEYREEDKSQLNLDDNFHRTSTLFDQIVDVVLHVQRIPPRRPILPLHRPVELQLPSQVSAWPVYNEHKIEKKGITAF